MESLRRWINEEGRSRSKWAILFALATMVVLVWPVDTPAQEMSKRAVFVFLAMASAFQFGRLVQVWRANGLLVQSPRNMPGVMPSNAMTVPSWERPTATPVSLDRPGEYYGNRPSKPHEIRAFASIEEGAENGWSFGDAVAMLGGKPVPSIASFNGMVYEYQGLLSSGGIVPPDFRVFGRLSYRQVKPEDTKISEKPEVPNPV